jgi:hypothetical protein
VLTAKIGFFIRHGHASALGVFPQCACWAVYPSVPYTAPAMKLNRIVCLLSLFAFYSASVMAQNSFTVGTATAGSGQKATGNLEIAAGVDAATSIPVVVIRGTKPGPVLALVSGAHGTEYASIIALEKVIQSSILRRFPAQSSFCRWSTLRPSNKKSRT